MKFITLSVPLLSPSVLLTRRRNLLDSSSGVMPVGTLCLDFDLHLPYLILTI